MATLIIENVDFELLEKQRKEAREFLSGERQDADGIWGILAMIDEWSDIRYFEKEFKKEERENCDWEYPAEDKCPRCQQKCFDSRAGYCATCGYKEDLT